MRITRLAENRNDNCAFRAETCTGSRGTGRGHFIRQKERKKEERKEGRKARSRHFDVFDQRTLLYDDLLRRVINRLKRRKEVAILSRDALNAPVTSVYRVP